MAFDPDAYLATPPASFDPDEYLKQKSQGPLSDPYSALSTLGRIGTGAATSIVDLAGGAVNALAGLAERAGIATPSEQTIEVSPGVTKTFGGRIPSVAAGVRSVAGIPELPEDASGLRRGVEAGLTGLATGGRSLVSGITTAPTVGAAVANTGRNVVTNAVLPTVGGEAGGAIGEKVIGGPEGRFIGSVVGGAGAGVLPRVGTIGAERYYGSQARPGADVIAQTAEHQDIPLTAGMLGNEKIQGAEKALAGRGTGFLPNPVIDARERALVAMREKADQAAAARGATHPSPTPGSIGERVLDTAEQTAQNLQARSSSAQQGLFDRVGPQAPVDVGPVYSALRAEIAKTDPGTARPMVARLRELEQMMPRDRTGQVVIGSGGEIAVPYQRMKDWRSNLGRATQTQEPVPAGHLDQIYGTVTDAMRETAARHGVSPAEFDAVQAQTRGLIGSGGPVRYFEKVAGKEGTSGERVGAMPPERAFNRVVDEQNPEGLQRLEQHADPQALNRIAGDTLRLRTQETLGSGGTVGAGTAIEGVRGGGAAGARKFANWWESMSPEAQRILGGNQEPTMRDLSQLSGAFNYPTRQTGLTRAVEGAGGGLVSRFYIANLLGKVAESVGLPREVGQGVGIYGVQPIIHYLQGRALQSDAAIRGLSGQRTPITTPNMADLLAQITSAINTNRPYQ